MLRCPRIWTGDAGNSLFEEGTIDRSGGERGDVQACFADELTDGAWLPRLRQMIPTYGIDLKQDADACRTTRTRTAKLLGTLDVA